MWNRWTLTPSICISSRVRTNSIDAMLKIWISVTFFIILLSLAVSFSKLFLIPTEIIFSLTPLLYLMIVFVKQWIIWMSKLWSLLQDMILKRSLSARGIYETDCFSPTETLMRIIMIIAPWRSNISCIYIITNIFFFLSILILLILTFIIIL